MIRESHPSRVRGLKFPDGNLLLKPTMSHPSRVRGLKFLARVYKEKFGQVAPFTGAWIEISRTPETLGISGGVAPFTGAWIEISILTVTSSPSSKSHPSRVRGLKFLTLSGMRHLPCGRTLHGCVD